MNISSGPLPGPVLPQQLPDFSALNGKIPDQPTSGGAISYGNSNAGGTDFSSLLNTQGGGVDQKLDSMVEQTLAQIIGQIMQALLPMIQQMLQGQQAGNESGNSATGGDQPGGMPAAAAGNPQPDGALAQTAPQSPLQTPVNSALQTSGSGIPLTGNGDSGLHLPESLKRHEGAIMNAANATDIPPEILAAQIWQETRGQEDAVTINQGNSLHDTGLMQVNQNTFAQLQKDNPGKLGPDATPSNPADSIMAGALYMKEQMGTFGDMGAALRAYNSGPGNVNVGDLTDISKTGTGDATYVDKVLNFAEIIKSGNGTLPA